MEKLYKNLEKIEKIIEYEFRNKTLLVNSMTHRSYPNEVSGIELANNERLEYLGDAILEFLTSDFLYHQFSNQSEGELTLLRSALVRTEHLAKVGIKLELPGFLFMSKGELALGNNMNEAIIADTFEALVGAIYVDTKDLNYLSQFLAKYVWSDIHDIVAQKSYIDSKTQLQVDVQYCLKQTPSYDIIKETGKEHNKLFYAVVKVGSKVLGNGSGKSKQSAEQMAAEDALKQKLYL